MAWMNTLITAWIWGQCQVRQQRSASFEGRTALTGRRAAHCDASFWAFAEPEPVSSAKEFVPCFAEQVSSVAAVLFRNQNVIGIVG